MANKALLNLAQQAQGNPELLGALKADPVQALKTAAASTGVPDTTVYRIIVIFAGGIGAACAGGIIALSIMGKQAPESLVALASAMGGGLVGALTPATKT